MGFLEDIVICRLSREFDRKNKKWYKECKGDSEMIVEYFHKRRLYILGKYRERLRGERGK